MNTKVPWGKVTMRKCDHQMITARSHTHYTGKGEFFDFPYIGKPLFPLRLSLFPWRDRNQCKVRRDLGVRELSTPSSPRGQIDSSLAI
jgi:hypothetical protein